MKFGLMKYDYTTNLGNEIQSIAARRFLPEIDCYVDHEKLNLFESDEKVKLIMNGWYLDCLKSWPPSDSIDPLLISMHFNTSVNETKEVILSKESREFFSSYGPVGCRDQPTAELLKENDIDAYFSGCLSLTLEGMKKNTDYKYVVVNSQKSEEIVNYLKSKTELDIFEVFQDSIFSLDKKYLDHVGAQYDPNNPSKCLSEYDQESTGMIAIIFMVMGAVMAVMGVVFAIVIKNKMQAAGVANPSNPNEPTPIR